MRTPGRNRRNIQVAVAVIRTWPVVVVVVSRVVAAAESKRVDREPVAD